MTCLGRLGPAIFEKRCSNGRFPAIVSRLSSGNSRENSPAKNRPMVTVQEVSGEHLPSESNLDELEVPTTCCMSGCANCVWIQYAEKLSEKMLNSDKDVQKIIMEKVQDPNMQAFLSMELRCRNLLKS